MTERENLKRLSESIRNGDQMLSELSSLENLTIEQKIVLTLYRKLIEDIDGCFVLADHQLSNPSQTAVRAALETYTSILYILEDESKLKDRALAYYYGSLVTLNKASKMSKGDIPEEIPVELFERTFKKSKTLLNDNVFKDIKAEWARTKKKNDGHDPNWFSLYDGPASINKLIKTVEKDIDKRVYGFLSVVAHGTFSINGLKHFDLINDSFALLPLRNEHSEAGFQEEFAYIFNYHSGFRIVEALFPSYLERYNELFNS